MCSGLILKTFARNFNDIKENAHNLRTETDMVNPCIEVAKENYHKIENKLKHTQKDSKVFLSFFASILE